MTERDSEELC